MNLSEAQARYGAIVGVTWDRFNEWCSIFTVPAEIAPTWINSATGKPTTRIYCNQDLHGPLGQAFQNVIDRGCVTELETFDGCFMIRTQRGSEYLSVHSYGMAIDLNAKTNQLGQTPTLSPALVACFTDAGFKWGGNFARKDGMHFQYALDW